MLHEDHHDHSRMDDDGAPPHIPFKRQYKRVGSYVHDIRNPTEENFKYYCEWRRSKCATRPRQCEGALQEEIDQATHEFVGECAELGELILTYGVSILYHPDSREKLLDEIGDIYFCGIWVMDAWGHNSLDEDLPTATNPSHYNYQIGLCNSREARKDDKEFTDNLKSILLQTVAEITSTAGLLCNSFKKLRWQRRHQDVETQERRVMHCLDLATALLVLAGFTIQDALAKNINKLDARYPNGYQPDGPGGGIRKGDGKG